MARERIHDRFHPSAPHQADFATRKSSILCVLDVGSSKVVCLIARLIPAEPSDMLRGRTHRARILGIGHQRSRGIKAGVVIDMDEAEAAVRLAVDAAERMAGVQVESVIVSNLAAGSARPITAPACRSANGVVRKRHPPGAGGDQPAHGAARAAPSCTACPSASRSTAPAASAIPRA